VPDWLGAGSLILAVVVFMRDHPDAERSQVDLVAAWRHEAADDRWVLVDLHPATRVNSL
jgi:hypothetical protein